MRCSIQPSGGVVRRHLWIVVLRLGAAAAFQAVKANRRAAIRCQLKCGSHVQILHFEQSGRERRRKPRGGALYPTGSIVASGSISVKKCSVGFETLKTFLCTVLSILRAIAGAHTGRLPSLQDGVSQSVRFCDAEELCDQTVISVATLNVRLHLIFNRQFHFLEARN